jgi:magnesium transporter
MPIVASMGGNAGTQTLTVTVRGLATGHITMKNALLLLAKELFVGSLNGTALALLLAAGVVYIYDDWVLASIIAAATVINHVFAAIAGHLIPLTLKKLRYDPAISSGVLVTTVTDVGGFFVFLGLAALFLL